MNKTHKSITDTSFMDDAGFRDELDRQGYEDVVARSRSNAVSSLIITLFFLGLTPFYTDHPGQAVLSLIAVVCLVAFRYAIIFGYPRLIKTRPVWWLRIHLLSICLVAVYWAWMAVSVLQLYGLNWVCMFMLIMVSGITSASTTSFSPRPWLGTLFVSIILIPVILFSYLPGTEEMAAISLCVCFYFMSLFIIARTLHRRYRLSFSRRYALKQLHDKLEQRVLERTAELARVNQVLLEGGKRYNALFSGITDAVLVHFTTENALGEKFVEANGVAGQILGYAQADLLDLSMADILMPESRNEFPGILDTLATRQAILFEQQFIRRDGQALFAEIHARRFEFKGREAVLYLIRDIGERKKIEKMMIQTEKIMSVGGLAAGMAHEINNPLAGIIQNSQVLRNRLTTPLPANLRMAEDLGLKFDDIRTFTEKRGVTDLLASILDAGRRAAEIVNNMLAFARKSSSQFSPEDIPSLMDKTLEIARSDYNLKKKFDFKNIAIHRDYAPDLPAVFCKPGEIQQVFFNILSNGAQAMMSMPEPREPAFTITISAVTDGIRITIQDTGPGVDPAIRERIFEPFFTTKSPGKGTGLGLYVSHMIIKNNHNGCLNLDSEPGKGTCFTIRLPLEQPQPDMDTPRGRTGDPDNSRP